MRKTLCAAVAAALVLTASAQAATVGTTFPAGFATPTDASLGTPVLGFGAAGPVNANAGDLPARQQRHAVSDGPATRSSGTSATQAQFFVDQGYSASEIWGLGYQGDQCDLVRTTLVRSGPTHTTARERPRPARVVQAVLAFPARAGGRRRRSLGGAGRARVDAAGSRVPPRWSLRRDRRRRSTG